MENERPRCPYCTDPLSDNLVCKSCSFAFERCSHCGILIVTGVKKCPQCGEPIVSLKSLETGTPTSGRRSDLPAWFDPFGFGSKPLLVYFIIGAVLAAVVSLFMYRARLRFIKEFGYLFTDLGLSETGYYYDIGLVIAVGALVAYTISTVLLIVMRVRRGTRQ